MVHKSDGFLGKSLERNSQNILLYLLLNSRERACPIIHVIRLYRGDGSNVDLCRIQAIKNGRQVLIPGSIGV
jgi:hypothetical protein